MNIKSVVTIIMLLFLLPFTKAAGQSGIFEVVKSKVSFTSEAPREQIDASSGSLKGIIDPLKKTFLFKIPIASFRGFNTPLQREHFNENYMESSHFPQAEFKGKIIEDIDMLQDGNYTVRAKGSMTIHGVEQPCIIKVNLKVKKKEITLSSSFAVALADFNIKIPRIVNDKLNPQIKVNVDAGLTYKPTKQ